MARQTFVPPKDPRWSLQKRAFAYEFSESLLEAYSHIFRPHAFAETERRSTCTGVLDSLFVLEMAQVKALARLFWSKFRERPAKANGACKVPRVGPSARTIVVSDCSPASACERRGCRAAWRGDGVAKGSQRIPYFSRRMSFSRSRSIDQLPCMCEKGSNPHADLEEPFIFAVVLQNARKVIGDPPQ